MDCFALAFGIPSDDHELAQKIRRQIDDSVALGHAFEDFQRRVQAVKAEHALRFTRLSSRTGGPGRAGHGGG